MIETEEQQLQCIYDLYHILKAQPKYRDLKEPDLKIDTPCIEVIKWLLRRLGPLAKGNHWLVDTYRDKNKTRFRFAVFQFFHSQKVYGWRAMPLDFLITLKRKDEALHDIMVDTIALISRHNHIPLWDTDEDFSDGIDEVFDGEEAALESDFGTEKGARFDAQSRIYREGIARQYLTLMQRRKKLARVPNVIHMLQAYIHGHGLKKINDRKQYTINWISFALRVVQTGKDLQDYTLVPTYPGTPDNYNPITPARMLKFIWCDHEADLLERKVSQKMMDESNQWGEFSPVRFTYTLPGETIRLPKEDRFPEDIWEVMRRAARLFNGTNRYYYYPHWRAKYTPSEMELKFPPNKKSITHTFHT